MSSGGGSYRVATQKTLGLEDGTPRRLRQLFTTVILYPAARSIGRIVVDHTGFAFEVQKERVFSMMKVSGLSMHAILQRMRPRLGLSDLQACAFRTR